MRKVTDFTKEFEAAAGEAHRTLIAQLARQRRIAQSSPDE
jgi:hypothetical protein